MPKQKIPGPSMSAPLRCAPSWPRRFLRRPSSSELVLPHPAGCTGYGGQCQRSQRVHPRIGNESAAVQRHPYLFSIWALAGISFLRTARGHRQPRNDRLVRPDDLKRVLDSARNVVVPSDRRRVLHAIPRTYALDGQVGVQNLGCTARPDVETHIITAAVSSIQTWLSA